MAKAPIVRREFPYKALLVVILAMVAIVACVLLVINAVIDSKMGMFKDEDPTDFNYAVAENVDSTTMYVSPEEIIAVSEPFRNIYTSVINNYNSSAVVNLKENKDILNYVTLVYDEEAGIESEGVVTIMLISVNTAEKKITYATINKGTAVLIPTAGVGPLYDAYQFGGIKLLTRTVQENFGVKINGYVELSLGSFLKAASDLGGIQIDGEKYNDFDAIKEYIYEDSETREAGVKKVVSALAAGVKEEGILGLNKIIKNANAKINIPSDEVSDLIAVGVRAAFGNEASVIDVGYATSDSIPCPPASYWIYNLYPEIFYMTFCDYGAEVSALHTALGYTK